MTGHVDIWADTIRASTCRSRNCHRTIYVAIGVKDGKERRFDQRPVSVVVQPELETNRERWTVSRTHDHMDTCVDAKQFRSTRGAHHHGRR